jgi:hypothetical protein
MKHVAVASVASAIMIMCWTLLPAGANAFEGFRGSTWGELKWELPKNTDDDLILDGWVRQGVDWKKWNGNTTLNTFATVRYQLDSRGVDWNNSVAPGVGIGIDTYNPKGIVLGGSIEYLWERYWESDRTEPKLLVFVNWYGWWDLKSHK